MGFCNFMLQVTHLYRFLGLQPYNKLKQHITAAAVHHLVWFMCVYVLRKATKEGLVETSSNITESLMSVSRMMSEQVKQSEDSISTLGKKNLCNFVRVVVFVQNPIYNNVFVCKHFPSAFPNPSSSLLNLYLLFLTTATSSRTVQETNEEFKNMTGTIHLGRKLILKYNRRELTDKLLIFLALALFFATVLYILKKRLFPFI